MHKTNISWTEFASNPIRAINTENGKLGWFCTKPSAGCLHCYAEALNVGRFGNGLKYADYNRGKAKFILIEKELESWARRKKPSKIFVCDMLDLFHEDIPDDFIFQVLSAMRFEESHTFQVLTKRPERMKNIIERWYDQTAYLGAVFDVVPEIPISNLWLGVSVEDQGAADRRIPQLLFTPAAVHFVSCEPLLEKIDIECYLDGSWSNDDALPTSEAVNVNWVIVGGESGPHYRRMDPDWARSLREQCDETGAAFFYKQASGLRPGTDPELDGVFYHEFPTVPISEGEGSIQ